MEGDKLWTAAELEQMSANERCDLPNRRVTAPGLDESFPIDDYTAWRLVEGLDDIGLTLRQEEKITSYEATREAWLPTA